MKWGRHDGRRTCATLLVDLDVHPREVMQILRHAQIAVTMEIYAQSFLKGYPGGVETAGRQPWQMTRCCTLLLHGALAGGVVSTADGL